MRVVFSLLLVVSVPTAALAQEESEGEDAGQATPTVISEPPLPAQEPLTLRPGEIILHGEPVRVRFQSPTRGVSFKMKAGALFSETRGWWLDLGVIISKEGTAFDPGFGVHSSDTHTKEYLHICEGQCEATLPSGVHRIALSLDGGKPLEPKHPTVLLTDSIVEGRYVNRRGLRIIGWTIWGVLSVTGSLMMVMSLNDTEEPYIIDYKNKAAFYAGLGLFVVSFGVGIPLAVQKDKAVIKVYPLK